MLLNRDGINVVDWSFHRNGDTIWSWKGGYYVEHKTKGYLACRVDATPEQMNQATQDLLKLRRYEDTQRALACAMSVNVGTLCDQGIVVQVKNTAYGQFIDVQTEEEGVIRVKKVTFKNVKRSLSVCEGLCPVCMCEWGHMFQYRQKVGDEWVESDDGVLMCGLCAEACVDVPDWVEKQQAATKRWMDMWRVNKPLLLLSMFKKW